MWRGERNESVHLYGFSYLVSSSISLISIAVTDKVTVLFLPWVSSVPPATLSFCVSAFLLSRVLFSICFRPSVALVHTDSAGLIKDF